MMTHGMIHRTIKNDTQKKAGHDNCEKEDLWNNI